MKTIRKNGVGVGVPGLPQHVSPDIDLKPHVGCRAYIKRERKRVRKRARRRERRQKLSHVT